MITYKCAIGQNKGVPFTDIKKETETSSGSTYLFHPPQSALGPGIKMPFHDEKPSVLSIETIATDAEAAAWLPPYPLLQTAYTQYRAEGLLPREALQQTLESWRELQDYARPVGYRRKPI